MEKDQPNLKKALEELEEEMLDDYCSDILKLLWHSEGMRFNEIYDGLRDRGTELSKPTLSEHLKHLTKKKWLTRKVTGFQSVTYTLHNSINRKPSPIIKSLLEALCEFSKAEHSTKAKADMAIIGILVRTLADFLPRIEIEPDIKYHRLSFNHSKVYEYENQVLTDCSKDKELRTSIIESANEMFSFFQDLHNSVIEESERKDNIMKR
jgi:predicted transcriptional regulator